VSQSLPLFAVGDELGEYLRRVPRDLSARRFRAWRERNPPPYLLPENRRGPCGVCGGPVGPLTRICLDCHRAELETARAR
jgi:hypothetical protein